MKLSLNTASLVWFDDQYIKYNWYVWSFAMHAYLLQQI